MMEQQKFSIIYADPPWPCNGAKKHYPLMKPGQIAALPVGALAAPDCALFLWTTFPNLPHALDVIEAWGFLYKTVAFTWVKRNRMSEGFFVGMGQWTRSNAEVCLLAAKGRPRRLAADVRQIIDAPVGQHSQKPDEARQRIVRLLGDLPRVELFARQAAPGWQVWGNEVACDIAL